MAAEIAGFEYINFMVESTAAAMGYGLFVVGSKCVLVFDIGGGTTDLTILKISSEGKFEVELTAGFTDLGGKRIDNMLYDFVIRKLKNIAMTGNYLKDAREFELLLSIHSSRLLELCCFF